MTKKALIRKLLFLFLFIPFSLMAQNGNYLNFIKETSTESIPLNKIKKITFIEGDKLELEHDKINDAQEFQSTINVFLVSSTETSIRTPLGEFVTSIYILKNQTEGTLNISIPQLYNTGIFPSADPFDINIDSIPYVNAGVNSIVNLSQKKTISFIEGEAELQSVLGVVNDNSMTLTIYLVTDEMNLNLPILFEATGTIVEESGKKIISLSDIKNVTFEIENILESANIMVYKVEDGDLMIEGINDIENIEVVNEDGISLQSQTPMIKSVKLNISDYPQGTYMLEISSGESKKIVKVLKN